MGSNLGKGLNSETINIFKEEKLNLSQRKKNIMPGSLLIEAKNYLKIEEIYKNKNKDKENNRYRNIKIDLIYCIEEQKYWVLKSLETNSENYKQDLPKEAHLMKKILKLNKELFIKGQLVEVKEEKKQYSALLIERGLVSLYQLINSRMKSKSKYSENELLYIFSNLIDRLTIMHQNGFYHIDIKPHNIILKKLADKNYEYFFCDFGSVVTDLERNKLNCSNFYAPKEENRDIIDLYQLDLFCLGITMIELMVLKSDFNNQEELIKYFKENENSLKINYSVLYPILKNMIEFKTNITEINNLIKNEVKEMPFEKDHKRYAMQNFKFSLDLEHLNFLENIFNLKRNMVRKHMKTIYEYIMKKEIKEDFNIETSIKLRYLAYFYTSSLCFKEVSEILDHNEKFKFIQDPFYLNIMLIIKYLSKGGEN